MTNEVTQSRDKTPAELPETTQGGRIYLPLTDIVETGGGVSLMLEMPGVAPGDLDIMLEKRVLTIRGRVRPAQPDTLRLVYAEYGEGDYERAVTLSEDFDPERIQASLSNGVLTVTLPRSEATQPKKIAVKAA